MMYKTTFFIAVLSILELSSSAPSRIDLEICKTSNGRYLKPDSMCRSFYACRNFVPKERQCPGDKHFSLTFSRCVSDEFPCQENITEVSPAASSKIDREQCKKRHGNFPKPGSMCRSYFKCTNFVPMETQCPGDQHFFPAKGYCVWPEEFPCLERPKSKDCLRPNGKFLKFGTGCREFYDCCGGIPTEKMCPGDLLFDPKRETCDWPELYTCVEDPQPLSKECPKPDGRFPKNGSECRIYYDCRMGIPAEKECPEYQLFDPSKNSCDWEELYVCKDIVITLKPTKSTVVTTTSPKTSTVSSTTRDPDSSEEDSEETKENRRSSTVSKKISDTTSEQSTSISTLDSNSSEETSSESNENIISTNSLPDSEFTSTLDEKTYSTASEVDLISHSLEITTGTENNIIFTVTENLSSSSIDTVTITEENRDSTVSDDYIATPSLKPVSVSAGNTDSTASVDDSTSSSTELVSISVVSTKSTGLEDDMTTFSLSPVSISQNTDSTVSENDGTTPSIKPVSVSEENVNSSSSGDDPTTPIIEIVPTSEKITPSTSADKDLTTLDIASYICPEPNGYYPHPTDKHKFIGCVGGDPRIMECPSKLVYDHKKRACDYDKKKIIFY